MRRIFMAGIATLTVIGSTDAQVEYEKAGDSTRVLNTRAGAVIRILVEESNLGSADVELAEIMFPAGGAYSAENIPSHRHGSIEIFYILEGQLEHIVNGKSYLLTPGMVGIVRPEDAVVHRVPGDEPVRALVIWAPGGEAQRLGPTPQAAE